MAIRDLTLHPRGYENKDFARVMASSRHLSRYGEGQRDQSRIRKQNLEHVRKAHRRLQCRCGRLDRPEIGTEHRLDIGEMPDSPDSSCCTRTTSIWWLSWIETITVPNLSHTGSSTATHSWAHGSNHSWQGYWQY